LDKGKGKATEEIAEYEGGEQLATVTVVEDFEVDGLGSIIVAKPGSEENPPPENVPAQRARNDTHKPSQPRSAGKAAKARPPKFRYETKAARKVTKTKERAKAMEKSTGGKGIRLSSGKPSRGKKASRRK
jgi:ribosomal RNA-processing protein 17